MNRLRKQRQTVTGEMRVNAYAVFHRAVDEGVAYGWRRAHKHTTEPGEDVIKEEIFRGVMNAVSEYFDFGSREEA